MKACLITPPSIFLLDERVFVNLGILKIAASLEAAGHVVEMLDLSGVSNYEEVVELHSRTTDATWFGITVTTPQMPAAAKIARTIRQTRIDASVVIGGPHPTLIGAALKREKKLGIIGRAHAAMQQLYDLFTCVVCGDGEDAVFEALLPGRTLIDADDPKGPLFMTNKRYEETPFPARHLVDMDSYHYTIEGHRATSLIAQLGCPFACFAPNTKIITSNGSNKKAKDVEVGDTLVALDETTKELTETTVMKKFVHDAEELYAIEFEDEKLLECTGEHPFYVRGEWIEARNLIIGDEIYEITPRDKMTVKMKLHNPVKRADVRQKISKTVVKRHEEGTYSYEHLQSDERRQKLRESNNFTRPDVLEAARKRMTENNPMRVPEVVARAVKTLADRVERGETQYYMRTPEYWKKVTTKFNKQERALSEVLDNEFPGRYKFVGDRSKSIEWYSPDFVDEEHKKIIEYHGCWWHGCPRCFPDKTGPRNRDEHREATFKKNGYKTHVVWSCDFLERREETLAAIRSFVLNGAKIASITKYKKKTKVYNYECSPHNNYFANYVLSHNCGFCGGRESSMLRRIRTRSTQSILTELEQIYQTYGYTGYMFYDDELNVNKNIVELMDGITDMQSRLGVEFRLRGFVKAELFTEKQAQAMHRAGFRWLLTGFESGSPRILENINKKATRDDNTRCFEIARKNGLKVKALMSIGHPGESLETARDTQDWLMEVRPDDFDVTIITTYPGTPYYDHAVETSPGIWTYTYEKTGDRLHAVALDYNETADYYKGDPDGGYKAYVYTDHLSSEELVALRGEIESSVRTKFDIPFNPGAAAQNFEHSMGQTSLPTTILRQSIEQKKAKSMRLPVIQ